jgi:hypothetical protein
MNRERLQYTSQFEFTHSFVAVYVMHEITVQFMYCNNLHQIILLFHLRGKNKTNTSLSSHAPLLGLQFLVAAYHGVQCSLKLIC